MVAKFRISMATKKVIIEQSSIFDDVRLIGITSPLIDYKIAIAFDRAANMKFDRLPDIVNEKGVSFSFYFYRFDNSDTCCDLISLNNKKENLSWLGTLPLKMDYLLILRGSDASDSMAKKITSKMAGYPGITTYLIKAEYNRNMEKITSKIESLILEAVEMHELKNDHTEIQLKKSNLSTRKLNQNRRNLLSSYKTVQSLR